MQSQILFDQTLAYFKNILINDEMSLRNAKYLTQYFEEAWPNILFKKMNLIINLYF